MYVCVFVSVCDIVSTAVCTRLPSSFPRAPRASIFRVCNGSTQMRSWRQHTDAWTLNVNKRCGTNLQQGPVTNDDQYRKVLHQEDKDNDPWLQFRVRHPARGKCVSTSRANYAGQRAGRHDDDDKSLGAFVSGWDPPVAMPTDEARRAALREAGAVAAVATSSSASSAPPQEAIVMPTDEARRAALRDAGAVSAVATSSSASSTPPQVTIQEELHQVKRAILHAATSGCISTAGHLSIMAQGDADDFFNLLRSLHKKVIQQLHHGEQDDMHGEHVSLLCNVLRQQWCMSDPDKSSEAMQWLEQAMHMVDKKLVRKFEIKQTKSELEVQIHAMQSLQRALDIVADHM